MTQYEFTLFDTAVGRCGLLWSPLGVAALQLPERTEERTRARLLQRFPEAVPGTPSSTAQAVIDGVEALLAGQAPDLSGIPLDMSGVPDFFEKVYRAARRVAPGQTVTYGELAKRVGSPGAARAVGQALGNNPLAILVPCHRVVAAGGRVGGFSGGTGIGTKLQLLNQERPRSSAEEEVLAFDREAAVQTLASADPELGAIMDRVGPFRLQLQRTASVFGALAEAIVYQQLNGKAAAAIFARVQALFPPDELLSPARLLRLREPSLRKAGLSASKILALRDLAERTVAGEVPTLEEARKLEDEVLIAQLTEVRGVGRWTVQMLLMFRLGRADVLPVDDFGVRKGFGMAFGLAEPSRADLELRAQRWRPYRSVASWYLWRVADGL